MDRLANILSSLSHLNLEGFIVQKQAHASGLGGSCDVYFAWSNKHNKKVAVKQIRAFLRKDPSLAKVRSRLTINCMPRSQPIIEIGEGDTHLGEAQP